jgi:hypothetical protein
MQSQAKLPYSNCSQIHGDSKRIDSVIKRHQAESYSARYDFNDKIVILYRRFFAKNLDDDITSTYCLLSGHKFRANVGSDWCDHGPNCGTFVVCCHSSLIADGDFHFISQELTASARSPHHRNVEGLVFICISSSACASYFIASVGVSIDHVLSRDLNEIKIFDCCSCGSDGRRYRDVISGEDYQYDMDLSGSVSFRFVLNSTPVIISNERNELCWNTSVDSFGRTADGLVGRHCALFACGVGTDSINAKKELDCMSGYCHGPIFLGQNNILLRILRDSIVASFVALLDELELRNPNAFCFYRCIQHSDRFSFVLQYLRYIGMLARNGHGMENYVAAVAHLLCGGMEFAAWISVMQACQELQSFNNTYILCEQTASDLKVMCRFGSNLGGTGLVKRILLTHCHLELIGDEGELNRSVTMKQLQALQCGRYFSRNRVPIVNIVSCKPTVVYGNSIPSPSEHDMLINEFRGSSVVAKFKNFDDKNNPVLEISVLKDIFVTLQGQLPSRFSYFKCLHPNDQPVFEQQLLLSFQDQAVRKVMQVEEVLARVASGGISLTMWKEIMRKCANEKLFRHHYVLYRRAYWGENSNEFSDNTIYSFYHCKVEEFVVDVESWVMVDATGNVDVSNLFEAVSILFDGYGHLNQLSHWFLNPSRHADPNRYISEQQIIY